MSTEELRRVKYIKGFSLIELMITIAIIGIIASVAYPSYMDSVRRSNRTDAKTALNDAAQRLQRCFTTLSTYANTANCTVRSSLEGTDGIVSPESHYRVTVAANGAAATTYILTATAISGAQQNDTGCTAITLTHSGIRAPADCW